MISAGIIVSWFHSDWKLSAEVAHKSDYFSVENWDSWGSGKTLSTWLYSSFAECWVFHSLLIRTVFTSISVRLNALRVLLLITNDLESSPLFPSSFNLGSADSIVSQWNAHRALVISTVCWASSCLPKDEVMAFYHHWCHCDSLLSWVKWPVKNGQTILSHFSSSEHFFPRKEERKKLYCFSLLMIWTWGLSSNCSTSLVFPCPSISVEHLPQGKAMCHNGSSHVL